MFTSQFWMPEMHADAGKNRHLNGKLNAGRNNRISEIINKQHFKYFRVQHAVCKQNFFHAVVYDTFASAVVS